MALKNNYPDLKELSDGYYYECVGENTKQIMACADLEDSDDVEKLKTLLPSDIRIVYSDPPWNAGNRKYWRTQASESHDGSYHYFLHDWCGIVAECIEERGTEYVFTEQSYNDDDRDELLDVVDGISEWTLPLQDEYKVFYGSPGSRSKQNPNILCYFSNEELRTDPTDMDGESMTIRACAGIDVPPGEYIFDLCMGKGMTSRMAYYYQWNCIGSELNPKRLGKTITWLERNNFDIEEKKYE